MQLDLGNNIRQLRRRDKKTQEALAEALGGAFSILAARSAAAISSMVRASFWLQIKETYSA